MVQIIVALIIVLASMVLLRTLLRISGAASFPSRRSMRIVESAALGTRQRLHIVEVDGQRLLIGSGPTSVCLVHALPEAAEAKPEIADGKELDPPLPNAWVRLVSRVALVTVVLVSLYAGTASAQAPAAGTTEAPRFSISVGEATDPEHLSSTLQIVALLTVVSVAPSILLMATCFTRILIVMSLVRQAVGIHSVPPNQVLVGLAMFTTFFVMAPVGEEINETALQPYLAREIDDRVALERAIPPIRDFLMSHTREDDLELFVSISGDELPEDLEEVGFLKLLPAFMISELRTAFEVGFTVFLPFLIIDIVVASMLISMGMIVLPPMMISLPFKLMLFVLLDGWNLVINSLVSGLT